MMKLTTEEKAKRYDALVFAIGLEKENFEKGLAECEKDYDRAFDSMAACLVGRKYAYKEFIEILDRWCNK
jgi:hypothetical protein